MRASQLTACAGTLLCLTSMSASAQDRLEDELTALVQSMNRLVLVLERQEIERVSESDFRQVELAVRILDIRARNQEALQKELRSLEDQVERTHGYIAGNEIRLQALDRQIAESIDETKRLELEAKKVEQLVYSENSKKRLEHFARRRVDLENRLIEGERLTRDVETIVESWLEDSQGTP